jgi:nitrogen fixation NifU-like protein
MGFDDLYQEIIMDHYRHPHNAEHLNDVAAQVHENPACGDAIKVVPRLADGRITKVVFDTKGCAISTASASMMSALLSGRSIAEARGIMKEFLEIMRNRGDGARLEQWGDLAALRSVMHFPVRVKCATLAWHALEQSLAES